MKSTMLRAALVLALGLSNAANGFAQVDDHYPQKPIKIVVPYPPGGTTDALTRMVAQGLSASLKQSVIVENRAGASGIIGSEVVAKSPPDGYTLLSTGSGPHAVNVSLFPKIPYDP